VRAGLAVFLDAAALAVSLAVAVPAQAQTTDRQGRQAADRKSGLCVDVTPTHEDGSSGLKRRRWRRWPRAREENGDV